MIPFCYLLVIKGVFLPTTSIVLSLFFLGMILGYFPSKKIIIRNKFNVSFRGVDVFVLWSVLLLQLWAVFRMYHNGIDLLTYRDDIFTDSSLLFGSSILFTLYNSFLFPAVVCLVIYNISSSNDSNKFIYLGFIVFLLDAVVKLGRFPLMYILFFIFIYNKKFNIKKMYVYIAVPAFVFISQVMIFFRQFFHDAAVGSVFDIIKWSFIEKAVIGYQYYGFLLFEKFTKMESMYGNFSSNSFSFFFYLYELFTTKFGVFIDYDWKVINLKLSAPNYIESVDVTINAFSTNFLPIYLDFGVLGIFMFGIYSGFVFGFKTKSVFFIFIKNLFFFILIFGIYQPLILTLLGFIASPIFFIFFARTTIVKHVKFT